MSAYLGSDQSGVCCSHGGGQSIWCVNTHCPRIRLSRLSVLYLVVA